MPAPYILNQPVSFGPDINIYPPNGCVGQHFYAPADRNYPTTFILPNNCPPTYDGAPMIQNGNFSAGLSLWSQGNGNGAVNEWTISSGKARGVPESKILNQQTTSTMEAWQSYKLTLDVTLNSGCTIKVVLYRAPYLEGSTDYIVIAEITETGTQVLSFTPTEDFIRIGFIVEGDCENSDLDNIEMNLAEYDCLEVCIKDLEGDTVATVTDIDYYGEFIAVTVDWGALDLDDGCYYICICNDPSELFFGENLWTYGDNGTFEDNADDVTSEGTDPERSTDQAYTGIFSYFVGLPSGTVPVMMLKNATDITLKRNTTYKLSAWVYIDSSIAVNDAAIAWKAPSGTGFTGATTDDSNSLLVQSAANIQLWKQLYIEFTTGTDVTGHFEIAFTKGSAWAGDADVWIDNIILYEVEAYESCSQGFNLKSSHGDTMLVKYRNDNPAFGFIYPDDFYFYMQIPAALQHPRYPEELKTFRTTDGIGSLAYADSTKVQMLAVNSIPEYLHDALRIAILHTTLYLDDVLYVKVPGEYRPIWDRGAYLAPAETEVQKVNQKTENAKC